jgi:alpha-1,2-mannosyltransferase
VWAVHRVLRAGQPVLALMCVALFGLAVSPVSWSHHWVWVLPATLTVSVLGFRRRSAPLLLVGAVGIALMVWTPIVLMPEHHETAASLWRRLLGASYLWWGLATIAVAGTVAPRLAERPVAPVGADPQITAAT